MQIHLQVKKRLLHKHNLLQNLAPHFTVCQ